MTREHPTRLSELMAAARLTDPALADLARTSKQQVFKLRRGDRKMSKDWADRLAPHLGVEWSALMEAPEGGVSSIMHPVANRRPARVGTDIVEFDIQAISVHPSELKSYPPGSTWRIPAEALPSHASSNLAVVKVFGDAMEPDFPVGSHVVVDCAVFCPTAPGVYVIWDGVAQTLKQVELLAGASPASVRINSINPRYAAYERPLEDVQVSGRVVGVWVWK